MMRGVPTAAALSTYEMDVNYPVRSSSGLHHNDSSLTTNPSCWFSKQLYLFSCLCRVQTQDKFSCKDPIDPFSSRQRFLLLGCSVFPCSPQHLRMLNCHSQNLTKKHEWIHTPPLSYWIFSRNLNIVEFADKNSQASTTGPFLSKDNQPTVVGKFWWQELETIGYAASIVKNAEGQLAFSFLSSLGL